MIILFVCVLSILFLVWKKIFIFEKYHLKKSAILFEEIYTYVLACLLVKLKMIPVLRPLQELGSPPIWQIGALSCLVDGHTHPQLLLVHFYYLALPF